MELEKGLTHFWGASWCLRKIKERSPRNDGMLRSLCIQGFNAFFFFQMENPSSEVLRAKQNYGLFLEQETVKEAGLTRIN